MGDAGVGKWVSRATLEATDFAEELGLMWDEEAERRHAAVREACLPPSGRADILGWG